MTDEAPVRARRGFFPFVFGRSVRVRQAGAMAIGAGGDLELMQGGGQLLGAGGNVSIREGGAGTIVAGGDARISQGGAGVIVTRSVTAEHSIVGVALAGRVQLDEGSRVLVTPPLAAIAGAVGGLVFLFGSRLLRRR